jgi:hypothetical protein
MSMSPRLRKLALTAHVTSSVGWLGAVAAYLALAVAAVTSRDGQLGRTAYLSMEHVAWSVIVPLSFATLVTGLIQSLGTEWGLFRHYWVLVKAVLAAGGTIVLLVHMQTVTRMATLAGGASSADAGHLPIQLVVHAAGGLVVLLAAAVLSVYKPWGRTRYGRRGSETRAPSS